MNKNSGKATGQYIYQISYNYRERLVGLFVFSGFILFLFFVVISVKNQHLFERRVLFYIELNSSEGISQGSTVTVLGAEAGRVVFLSLADNHKIRVAIEVYEAQRRMIRKDAKVVVNRLTGIGNALIEIKSESINAPLLEDGATIPAEETPSLNDLLLGLANLVQSADNNNLLSKFEQMLPKLEQTLENIHEIISQIASGHGTLGAAVFDQQVEKELKVVVKSGAELLLKADSIVDTAKQRLIQLEPVLQDAQQMSQDLRGTTQNLPEMAKELQDIITQIKTALELLNTELGDLPGVAIDARRTLNRADRLLDSVQQTWPLSTQIQKTDLKPVVPVHPVHD